MSMSLLHKTIINKIDVIRKRFFWQGGGTKRKYHLVKWSRICQTKEKGGLGVKDLRKMNISLLCKWWWKIEKEEGLWQEIVRQKYLQNPCIAQLKKRQSNSPFWNDLLSIRSYFLKGRMIKVGNGSRTDFWQDSWCGSIPLKDQFPALFEICNEQVLTIEKALQHDWRLTFRRWLDIGLQEQWRTLRDMLFSYALNNEEDLPVWK